MTLSAPFFDFEKQDQRIINLVNNELIVIHNTSSHSEISGTNEKGTHGSHGSHGSGHTSHVSHGHTSAGG